MVSGLRSRTPKTPPERNQGENSPGAATSLAAQSLQQSKGGRARGAIARNKGKKHDTAVRQLVWDVWQRCVGRNKALGGERGLRSKPGTTELQAICRLLQPPGGPLRCQVQWCRRWISRKIQDPDFNLGGNASGAGGSITRLELAR